MHTEVVVLAAGKGTRMYSDLPKVLHALAGKPMLTHVLEAALTVMPQKVHLVTGFQSDLIKQRYSPGEFSEKLNWVEQTEQLGTGHAVMQAAPHIQDNALVLVLYGDVPLIKPGSLSGLLNKAADSGIAVLTLVTDTPHGLGRIVRDDKNKIVAIVEEKDATEEQRRITEINTGIMAFNAGLLKSWLQQLNTNNAQGEYYLTDTVSIAHDAGIEINSLQTSDADEVQGVNDRLQLSELERSYQLNKARQLAKSGVTIADVNRLDVRGELQAGRDVILDINIVFEGKNRIGNRVTVGPNVVLINCEIGDDCEILANSHLESVVVEQRCTIGPFARLRPGTVLMPGAKIGNFVETKKAIVGPGSKINHLSYVGDAELGASVNIGAGTITCNYDGVNKFKTTIKDGVFVGSNTALVAPVTVGVNATIGAGSVITHEVPDQDLAVARGKQRNISGWKRPVKIKAD
ncbi:MAG: bifunctional UDP-N-acetylglucosamine diphosphorylase/glucosamine-1-phosphate N-acetyltransferase GlmU [Pseudohongiella sp.]|nr:bifunctional UDP-N-acetylglucosamine diphosphorylase/glucosamine-1-phosphate N-acetyltransferase GlmU [Pseudohongiella sp.]MDP2126838.1 bifunctional UDP-N-acetylglucosamine diphosphorylase/glucosamine-1-phosphate N-acetyltransferase GlmU [Pseudohongiella sp.]